MVEIVWNSDIPRKLPWTEILTMKDTIKLPLGHVFYKRYGDLRMVPMAAWITTFTNGIWHVWFAPSHFSNAIRWITVVYQWYMKQKNHHFPDFPSHFPPFSNAIEPPNHSKSIHFPSPTGPQGPKPRLVGSSRVPCWYPPDRWSSGRPGWPPARS